MTMALLGTLQLLALCNSIQFRIGNAAFEAGRVEADSSNSSDERAGEIQRTAPGLPALELPRPLASASIPWVMAYRGASTAWPEHSIGAYKEAIEQGAQWVECDLVLTRDAVPVCRHEPNLAQTTDALSKFGNRLRTYPFDGNQVEGIFTADLSAAELGMLKSKHPPPLADDPRYVEPSWGAPEDMRVATLDRLIIMLQEQPHAVGLAIHVQSPTWHTSLMQQADNAETQADPRAASGKASSGPSQAGCDSQNSDAGTCSNKEDLKTAGSTGSWIRSTAQYHSYEDVLLDVLEWYGYVHPLYSPGWAVRPVLIMSFEFGWLERLAARTRAPLVQVLSPKAPDTGASFEVQVSAASLQHIASYAQAVALAKGALVQRAPPHADAVHGGQVDEGVDGGGGHGPGAWQLNGLVQRLHAHKLLVFASAFRQHSSFLLPGVGSSEEEYRIVLQGTKPGTSSSSPDSMLDGLFTDDVGSLRQLLQQMHAEGAFAHRKRVNRIQDAHAGSLPLYEEVGWMVNASNSLPDELVVSSS